MTTPLRSLFSRDVTRDIPPVVYFHEQGPEKLAAEVHEYIVTGGWPTGHPNQKRVPEGIHEQYVKLLTGIATELDKPGGPDLPTAWISGFYGSGKSSFAKLMGLSLDRAPTVLLPDGHPLYAALLARDTSPRAAELRAAYDALIARITPLSVVFDIGGTARDHEHVHAVAVRQVQKRLGYSQADPHVADFELRLEKDGEWPRFLDTAERILGRPWSELQNRALAEEDFSLVLHHLFPQHYPDPTAWFASRGSARTREGSPQDATHAIRDMLRFRAPDATVFLIVDEVSQYVLGHRDRVDRLRAFATELGATLRGKVWLIALGQQKLDEQADQNVLQWMRDRFPKHLQLHLAPTNIRDVIHRRLLQKTPAAEALLRQRFEAHRSKLQLNAYGAAELTPDDFVEVYPLLPNHIDLLLQITSALRLRTTRAQGDDHGIRGVLQLLGELFRSQRLADAEIGALVTFDRIYDVLHTALDSDLQASMARVLNATTHTDPLELRAAKVVALLEHIQETTPTSATLVSQCLYERDDLGDREAAVTAALEALRQKNLLGYAEKTGYKIQSSSAEEWEDEKTRIGNSHEQRAELVRESLTRLAASPARPRLHNRDFPWRVTFATRLTDDGVVISDSRDQAAMVVDLRWMVSDERGEALWIKRSGESTLATRLVWVGGDDAKVIDLARELFRSRDMVSRYKPRRESLVVAKKNLLNNEEARSEELQSLLDKAVDQQFSAGRMYFNGRVIDPREHGQAFSTIMTAAATRVLPEIYGKFLPLQVQPSQLTQLLSDTISGISHDFVTGPLSLFDIEADRYVPTATGEVPTRLFELITQRSGMSGQALLAHFAAPPYAWPVNVVKAGVIGLIRKGALTIRPEDGVEVSRVRDPGVRDLFDKDRAFRAADFYPANAPLDPRFKNKVARLFKDELGLEIEREEDKIADAVAAYLPTNARRARATLERYHRVPRRGPSDPAIAALTGLPQLIDGLVGSARYTEKVLTYLQKDLDPLRDGLRQLATLDSELSDDAVDALITAERTHRDLGAQLRTAFPDGPDGLAPEVDAALTTLDEKLSSARPWLDLAAIRAATALVTDAYRARRQDLIELQEREAEAARARLRARLSTLTLQPSSDQQHRVFRPIALAITHTTAERLSPELVALREPFIAKLRAAEESALETIDELIADLADAERTRTSHVQTSDQPTTAPRPTPTTQATKPVVRFDLKSLRLREVDSPADVRALLVEFEDTLMDHIRAGKRVRLV